MPASFGYSMTGNTDIDQNGYPGTRTLTRRVRAATLRNADASLSFPDLIVGVFGADKAVLYR